MEDAKRGKYQNCKQALTYLGFSEHEAETACSKWLSDTDEELTDSECVSRKIHILAKEHPSWKHSKKVAVAHAYCGLSKKKSDAIGLGNIIGRLKNLSLSKFSTLVKTLKTKMGLKVGAMGIIPQDIELPMKNLNRLQTKLEKLVTEEEKQLTMEQYEQRKQYARFMRKRDSMYEEIGDAIDDVYSIIESHDRERDNVWILSNEAEIISFNDGLNNIIKAPVILAREMIQPYDAEDGYREYHFKPYDELKKAIEGIDSLDIIIEHQDWYEIDNIMGYVKQLRADDNDRSIKGTAYLYEKKLPKGLKQMISDGEIIPVSIGFLAKLGESGRWNEIAYDHTQEDILLRHLAICLKSVARCPEGMCGINLGDSGDEPKGTESKIFTIINKESYYYNICDIVRNINDSKKETNKKNILSNKDEKVEPMLEDAKNDENLPQDFEAVLKWIRNFVEGKVERQSLIDRILAALGINKKSDSNMDEKEYKDALALKDSEIEELKSSHKEILDSKDTRIKELEDRERIRLIKSIKKFGDKYSDEELEDKELKSLIEIEDAVSRFAPSEEKPNVLPIAPKEGKEEMEKELKKDSERIDFSRVFEDVNKEFNMSNL